MPINYDALPPLSDDPAHAEVVATLNRLRQTQVEAFLARCTGGSHAAAIFLREVLYWLSPSDKAPTRPRSTVYRNGAYWMARTQARWKEDHALSRSKLETIYRRCASFLEIDHFMFASQRQTHYRLRFEKLREAMAQDEALQACLQSDLDAAETRRPVGADSRTPVCGKASTPSLHSIRESNNSLEITGDAGASCVCSPSAPSGAAAPEPPLAPPPARSRNLPDSVEAAPAEKQEITNFKEVQVILQPAEGEKVKAQFPKLVPYGERTFMTLGYLLIWQAEYAKVFGEKYRFTEAHFLHAQEFFDAEHTNLQCFLDVLRAAWKVVPREGFDPCFMCSRHSTKFTLFCKHFTRMEDELDGDGRL